MDAITRIAAALCNFRRKKMALYAHQAADIQQRQLGYLLTKAADTEWGIKHRYRGIARYEEFCRRVPLQTYDSLKPFIRRMMEGEKNILWPGRTTWFARSSGTTSDKSKFIPVTPDILCRCHYRGGADCVSLYLHNNTHSRLFARKGLILGGSHSPAAINSRTRAGDLSAVLIQNLPPPVDWVRVPKRKIILMDEWQSKIEAIVKSTRKENISSLSGVPSWMLMLIRALLQETGQTSLSEIWPHLEVFFHGGVSFEPYREQFKALTHPEMYYMETYNASEGFFGIQSCLNDRSLLLMIDYGILYEFIPIDGSSCSTQAIPLADVQAGKNYAMVISTPGGLWRYQIGDTIRFTQLCPYKFVITGRTRHHINAFGEELMVDNADRAIANADRDSSARVREYTACPIFLPNKAVGRHQWVIEFERPPASIERYAALLDKHLKELNSDYEAKRYKDLSLLPPQVTAVRQGTFYQWLGRKGKLGGQHKVPRLSNEPVYVEELLSIHSNT